MTTNANEKTDTDKPLLTYTVSTTPSPLEISTETPTLGEITFSVGKKDGVYCKRIIISIPTGGVAKEIFSKVPPVVTTVSSANWSPSMEVKTGKELGFEDDLEYTVIKLANNTSENNVTESFTVTASGNVNKLLGPATVKLDEKSSHHSSTGYNYKNITFPILKSAAPGFYIRNFVASLPATPTVPATEFSNGTEFQLSWESNGTYYNLYKKGETAPVYSGNATSYTVTGGISTDTTFVLTAKDAQVVLYDTITITVSNPSLTPQTAVVSSNATVGGTLGVTGNTTLSNVTASGTLGVTGETTLSNIAVGGTLGVIGKTTLSNVSAIVTASESLTVTGATTLKSTGVTGHITVNQDTNYHAVYLDSNSASFSTLKVEQKGNASTGAFWSTSPTCSSPALVVNQAGPGDAANFNGSVSVSKDLTVDGNFTLKGAAGIKGACWIQGDIYNCPPHKGTWQKLVYIDGYAGWEPANTPLTDQRLKENVQPISKSLEKVTRLSGVRFRWNPKGLELHTRDADRYAAGPDASEEENRKVQEEKRQELAEAHSGDQLGLLAQEVQEVLPEAVKEDEDGYLRVAYDKVTPLLVESIKELKEIVDRQSEKIEALEKKLADLK